MVHSVLHSHTTAILPTLAPLPTPTAQHPHEPVMKASPPPTIPPRPQCPASQDPWGSAEEGSHLLGAQPTRRQSGGAMGRAEGKGRQKGRTSFFFFLHPSQGGVSAGGGSPPGPLSGDHACPGALSPLPQLDPYTSCPQKGSNPPQGWGARQSGDRKRACFSLLRRAQTSPV